jgi:hypothetical protein
VRRRSLPWRYAARRVLVGRSAVTVARCRSRSGEGGAIADARLANRQLIADGFRMRADSMEACRFILAGAVPISVLAASVFLELPQDLVARCIHRTAIFLFVTLWYFGIVPFRGAPTLLRLGDGAVSFSSGLVGSVGTTRCSYFSLIGTAAGSPYCQRGATALTMHGAKPFVY